MVIPVLVHLSHISDNTGWIRVFALFCFISPVCLMYHSRCHFFFFFFFCSYPLAVTLHKDNEVTSSSMYAQGNPWEPVVSFEDYIRDNENIVNQVHLGPSTVVELNMLCQEE